jgi:hypothetical protein
MLHHHKLALFDLEKGDGMQAILASFHPDWV